MKQASLRLLPALALLGLVPVAAAQTAPLESTTLPLKYDSGWVQNAQESGQRQVVASFPVDVAGAEWLRLKFAEVDLSGTPEAENASILRVTSMLDGHEQRLNAVHVQQWRNTTAYFNGDAVLIELLAYPGTGANRFVLDSVTVGLPPTIQESQCGPTDDRVLSNDPAAARLLPVGCTGWIIDDDCGCFLTAGHCSFLTSVAQFNVPLSTSGGGLVNPPPEDQYSVDSSSMQSNGGLGIGNDYAYFGVFPNSNTGLTPRQAQGAEFEIVNPPAFQNGQIIRITGYGTDFTPATHNQVQQTHSGPRIFASGTVMEYQVDTTGGSSGSPVIFEATGQGVGIHTHAGCSSTGGNHGTSIAHPGLQAFLNDPQGVCFKASCGVTAETNLFNGSGVNPTCLSGSTNPVIGANWVLEVDTSGFAGAIGSVLQVRRQQSSGTFIGSSELLIDLSSALVSASEAFGSGTLVHSIPVPNVTELIGLSVYAQGGVIDNGQLLGLCNAAEGVVGCQ